MLQWIAKLTISQKEAKMKCCQEGEGEGEGYVTRGEEEREIRVNLADGLRARGR